MHAFPSITHGSTHHQPDRLLIEQLGIAGTILTTKAAKKV
jgi:hypothetical protein